MFMRLSEMVVILFVVGLVLTGLLTWSGAVFSSNPDVLATYSGSTNVTLGALMNLSEDLQSKMGTNQTTLQTGEEVSFLAIPAAWDSLQLMLSVTPGLYSDFVGMVAQALWLPDWFVNYVVGLIVFVIIVAAVAAIFKDVALDPAPVIGPAVPYRESQQHARLGLATRERHHWPRAVTINGRGGDNGAVQGICALENDVLVAEVDVLDIEALVHCHRVAGG